MNSLTFWVLVLTVLAPFQGIADSSKSKELQISALADESLKKEDTGDFSGAIQLTKKILDLDPRNPIHFVRIGGLNGKLGNFEEEIKPRLLDAHINKGSALAGLGRKEDAKKSFRRALDIDPQDSTAYYSLGRIEEQFERNYKRALKFYVKATELNPKCEDCHFNAAAAAANLGLYDLASKEAELALQLNPNSQEITNMLERIKRLQKPR